MKVFTQIISGAKFVKITHGKSSIAASTISKTVSFKGNHADFDSLMAKLEEVLSQP